MIALTFVLLLFAIVDLGFLVNSWVRLSSATRDVARLAAVGYQGTNLESMVRATALPGVSPNVGSPFTKYCCDSNDKVVLTVTYYPRTCTPPLTGCTPIPDADLLPGYWPWPRTARCTENPPTQAPRCHPQPGDTLVVSLVAPGMEVITPLVRPFFESNRCQGNQLHCYVRLGSTTMVRFEGNRTGG
jgi:hypothetical protein